MNKLGLNKLGLNKLGLNKLGLNKLGLNKSGRGACPRSSNVILNSFCFLVAEREICCCR